MSNTIQTILVVVALVFSGFALLNTGGGSAVGTSYDATTFTNPITYSAAVTNSGAVTMASTLAVTGATTLSGALTAATTTVENLTTGGQSCILTDATGGTYTLTEAQMAKCGMFTFAAGGAGQAAIALTFPATSTMTTLIPNAGDCKSWTYDASNLAAATTTTMTAGTGHNVIAYTTNDDVIDGNEFSQITMCRAADTDVNTFVTEMLLAG